MAKGKRLKIGKMEGAPDWYGTPLDKLHFEWSREEELELERYCEKIIKNIAEEDMTPRQRFVATMEGKPKDRLFIDLIKMGTYTSRMLDSHANALMPGDLYKRPKLFAKAELATAARHKVDIVDVYTIAYAENFFGADARMMDYGTPMVIGDPPIKTLEDLEDIEVPDPRLHGLYPGYLWANREIMRILKKYEVDLPVAISYCGGPLGTCMMGNMMMSMPSFMKALRKDPEFAKRVFDVASQWSSKYGRALAELNPDAIYLCDVMGSVPRAFSSPSGPALSNEWILDFWVRIAKDVKSGHKLPYMWQWTGGLGTWMDWMPLYATKGVIGTGNNQFCGWLIGYKTTATEEVFKFSREHDIVCWQSVSDLKILEGDPTLQDDIEMRAKVAKLHPKHGLALGPIDYWTPPEHLDQATAWSKKYKF